MCCNAQSGPSSTFLFRSSLRRFSNLSTSFLQTASCWGQSRCLVSTSLSFSRVRSTGPGRPSKVRDDPRSSTDPARAQQLNTSATLGVNVIDPRLTTYTACTGCKAIDGLWETAKAFFTAHGLPLQSSLSRDLSMHLVEVCIARRAEDNVDHSDIS